MIISPYTPDVVRPQYEAFKYNTDLIGKVLLYKQTAYDEAYKNIQNLRQQALNINFLNEKEQGKIDSFNNQVNTFFSKIRDYGDLSSANVQQQYTRMFDIIGKDPELIKRYRQDAKYQSMLLDVEKKKNAKDPFKEGFHPINYSNFLSRIEEYSQTDLDAEDFKVRPYQNYVDYNQDVTKLVREVPIKKYQQDIPTGDGRIITVTRVGRDPNEVRRVISTYMQSKGAVQLREEAEYNFRSNQDVEGMAEIYNQHVDYINKQKQILSTQLNSVMARIKTAKGEDLARLAEQQAQIETKLSDLDMSQYSAKDFYNRDNDEIIGDLTNINLFNTVDNLTQAYGGYAESRTLKADSAFFELAKLNNNLAIQQAKLKMAQLKAEGKLTAEGAPLSPDALSTSQPVTVDYGSVLEGVQASLTSLEAQNSNIFESGLYSEGKKVREGSDLAKAMLRKPDLLDKNPYYADSPWVEAFKLARLDALRKYDVTDENIPLMLEEILPRVNQIVNSPKTKQEVAINRKLQDIQANKVSVKAFLEEANKSGDPVEFIRNRPNIYSYGSGFKHLDPSGLTGDRKEMVNEASLAMEAIVQSQIGNIMDFKDEEGNQILGIDREWMKYAQVFDNGMARIYFDPQLFKEGDPEASNAAGRPGLLAENYFVINGVPQRPTVSKPYIEIEDPRLMKTNWSKHLGLRLVDKPQTRYGWSKDQKSIPFEVRMVNNQIQFAINGRDFQDSGSANPEIVINKIYQLIESSNSTDLQPTQ